MSDGNLTWESLVAEMAALGLPIIERPTLAQVAMYGQSLPAPVATEPAPAPRLEPTEDTPLLTWTEAQESDTVLADVGRWLNEAWGGIEREEIYRMLSVPSALFQIPPETSLSFSVLDSQWTYTIRHALGHTADVVDRVLRGMEAALLVSWPAARR